MSDRSNNNDYDPNAAPPPPTDTQPEEDAAAVEGAEGMPAGAGAGAMRKPDRKDENRPSSG